MNYNLILFFGLLGLVHNVVSLDITILQEQFMGTDSYSVIQKSLTDIHASGGGTLKFGPGTFIVSRFLNIYSDTQMVGDGIDKTILKLQDYAAPWKVGNVTRAGFLRGTVRNPQECHNIVVIGLTLDGNKLNQNTDEDSQYGRYGFFTEACRNVFVSSVRIQNFQGYGFDPHGLKPLKLYGKNLIIVNSIANDNDWDGFTLDQTNLMLIRNCTSYNNGRHGYNIVTGSRNAILADIRSYDNGFYYYTGDGGCGIAVQNNLNFGTRNIIMIRTDLNNDNRGGICINDITNVVIKDAIIETFDYCVKTTNSRNVLVSSSYCDSDNRRFIVDKGSLNVLAVDNKVSWTTTKEYPIPPLLPVDPSCLNGIVNKNICCSSTCGSCGGFNCRNLEGGPLACCIGAIVNSTKTCTQQGAPCIIV